MMKIFSIRYWKRKRALKKINNQHSGIYCSLDKAERIGFIIDMALPDYEKAATYLCHELRRRDKIFYAMAVDTRDSKEKAEYSFPNIKEITLLTRKDTNRWGRPQSDIVAGFTYEKFDIFIDLSAPKRNFTLDYILKNVKSDLLIGTNYCPSDNYDLKVTAETILPETNENGETIDPEPVSGIILVKNILNYLTTIK